MIQGEKNNKKIYFKGQYPDEIIFVFFRHHWVLLLPHLVIFCCLIFLLVGVLIALPILDIQQKFKNYFQPFAIAIIALISFLIHAMFIKAMKHFLDIVIITNFRIIEVKKSIFSKDFQDTFSLADIQDVQRDQTGFFENIFGYGELVITLPTAEKIFFHVPNPNYHFRLIIRAKEHYEKIALPSDKTALQ